MPTKANNQSFFLPPGSAIAGFLIFFAISLTICPSVFSGDEFLENGGPTNIGSDAGFLLDTPTRLKIDLAGKWNYEREDGGSGIVGIPSAYDFTGKVTFSRTFAITAEMIDRYDFHIVMFGVNYSCDLFLNGDFVMNHAGGYTSFMQRIPESTLQPGTENQIKVVVNNRLDDRNSIPLKFQVWGWRNYGGIFRDIFILATPKIYLHDIVIQSVPSPDQSSAKVSIDASVEGEHELSSTDPKSPLKLAFYAEIFDKISGFSAGKSAVIPLHRSGDGWSNVEAQIAIANPKLWSPDFPELYVVKSFIVETDGKTSTVLDEMDVNHGIRLLEISRGDFHLNGQRIVLKGVVWNEDHPTGGSALTYEQMEKDVVLVKSLGANAIRFANHPPHPYMLNLCDRYGLMALVELPVSYTPSQILREEEYTELAGAMLKEMIVRDRTHASVLAWGIGEGFESSAADARPFVEALRGLAKTLDDRPVYIVSQFADETNSDLVDFTAVSIPSGDVKLFKQELEKWKSSHPDKPVLLAKLGTEVQHNNRNGYSDPLSYEAQARFYLQRFDALKSVGYDGAFVWSFNDWRGDRPALTVNSGDPWMHTMGLVSYQREKRLAYDAVHSIFRGEKFVALPSGSYSATAPIIYVLSGLVLLIGSAYLYNADRRFRESLNRSLMSSYNFFADIRDQRVVSVLHSAVLGIIVSIASAIVGSTVLYHFRDSWLLDALLSYFLSSDHLKEMIIHLVLNPMLFIVYFSLIFFGLLLLVTLVVRSASPFLRSRIYLYHAYSLTMWSTVPLLILVPLGMILFRLMESDVYVAPSLLLLAGLLFWVLLRLYKGVSIIADVYRLKVYAVGFSSLIGIIALGYLYLDFTQSASEYLRFLYNVVSSSH